MAGWDSAGGCGSGSTGPGETGEMPETTTRGRSVFNSMQSKMVVAEGFPRSKFLLIFIVCQVLFVDVSFAEDNEEDIRRQCEFNCRISYPNPSPQRLEHADNCKKACQYFVVIYPSADSILKITTLEDCTKEFCKATYPNQTDQRNACKAGCSKMLRLTQASKMAIRIFPRSEAKLLDLISADETADIEAEDLLTDPGLKYQVIAERKNQTVTRIPTTKFQNMPVVEIADDISLTKAQKTDLSWIMTMTFIQFVLIVFVLCVRRRFEQFVLSSFNEIASKRTNNKKPLSAALAPPEKTAIVMEDMAKHNLV